MARPKLLCVDDDAGVRELYRLLLGSYGYEVIVAEDGNHALDLFRAQKFDSVVLDQEMPGLRGSEVAALLKREHPEIPIIMVSGCPSVIENSPQFVDAAIPKGSPIVLVLNKISSLLSSTSSPPKNASFSRFLPLGSALATVAFLGFLVPRLWR